VLEPGKCAKVQIWVNTAQSQIVIARQLGLSISKTAALEGCSQSVVVSIYQKWSKEGTVVVMSSQGSLINRGSEGWPMWSNPKDKLL